MVTKSHLRRIWVFILVSMWSIYALLALVSPDSFILNISVLGIAVSLSAALALVYRKQISIGLARPYNRKLISSLVTIVLTLLILIIINFMAVKTKRTVDVTKSKLHTLSEQTQTVAKKLNSQIKISLFAPRDQWERYLSLLRQYEALSSNIVLEAVDIDAHPAKVRALNITAAGEGILEYDGRKVKGMLDSELNVTNLMIKVMSENRPTLYYTVGHGELLESKQGKANASFLLSLLNDASYQVIKLDTLAVDEIPRDADGLLIMGPTKSFMDLEVETIGRFLSRGGNLIAVLGPSFEDVDFSNFKNLLRSYGVQHQNVLVLDRLSSVQGMNATVPIVKNYASDHSITKNFSERTLFSMSAALSPAKNENVRYVPLAQSSNFPASWGESDLKNMQSGKVYFNKGLDLKGPLDLLVATQNLKTSNKIVVAASSEMFTDFYKNHSANFNLFMNALAWTLDDEGIISLNRPQLSSNMIILSTPQVSLIFYFSILFLPFVFFAVAFWVYRKRAGK